MSIRYLSNEKLDNIKKNMSLKPISKRELKKVGAAIWQAVDVMEKEFGGCLTHDSNHDEENGEEGTTWIFTFPEYAEAQVAIGMNVRKVSLLMRGTTLDGRPFEELASKLATVEKRYTKSDSGVASSVLGARAPYLNPSPFNPILRVVPINGNIFELLRTYLGARPAVSTVACSGEGSGKPAPSRDSRRPVTAAELYAKLDRQAEVGSQGEEIARLFEIERLRGLKCPDPERWVVPVAVIDVARGYDIESKWPGHERFIEVKSSIRSDADIFVTENERKILTDLGSKAWLYRVVIRADGIGKVEFQLQNPMNVLPDNVFVPVAFRVGAEELKQASVVPLE